MAWGTGQDGMGDRGLQGIINSGAPKKTTQACESDVVFVSVVLATDSFSSRVSAKPIL